ncbi:MAG: hypothetical protein GX753_04855 [Erysipelothrix sp.]|nr:hypothetical protein [Erysipelothrix sp.]
MTFLYDAQVLEDLKSQDKVQSHMLLDYFEKKYVHSEPLEKKGHVFKTGPWRILFLWEHQTIKVLRIIR